MEAKLDCSVKKDGEVVKVSLAGKLDATNAPELLEELKALQNESISEIVFLVEDLEYIASAGVRTMIFSKQKIGKDTDVHLVAPQDDVLDVIKMSGLDNFLIIEDEYKE
ncbi:MAG: STAS domain-containing protein [Halanaerobacter sp.]